MANRRSSSQVSGRRLSLGEMVGLAALFVALCGLLNTSPGTPLFELWCRIGLQLSNCPVAAPASSVTRTPTATSTETTIPSPATDIPTATETLTPTQDSAPLPTAQPTGDVDGVFITRDTDWLVVRFVGNLTSLALVEGDTIHAITTDFDLRGNSALNVTGQCYAYQVEGTTAPVPDPGCPVPAKIVTVPLAERWWSGTFSVEQGARFKGFCDARATVCAYNR